EYLTNRCKEYGLKYYPMMEERGITIKNAIPTSEGVISYLIKNRIDTIANSKILVIGYGVCGSDLSKKLKALGANVYALVRNREKEATAYADSITPIYAERAFYKPNFDVIINTVPECVMTNEVLQKCKGTLFIDIASKPYGFDMEFAKKLNEKSALLPGIPGKYAVRTAGEILGEYINQVLKNRGENSDIKR
ncbi:MAG: NAD(P)-binding domain-containing protein, partial [Defluviitaleaceae bacterium]|nr:NAD(P)-binding domain-containing protein [Defluviitaleaceae bacterium]